MMVAEKTCGLRRILSHDAGPFWQFVKYGAIGVMSTLVQFGVFYLLAFTCLRCITQDDIVVTLARNCFDLELPTVAIDGDGSGLATRGTLAVIDTAVGFVISNFFCWLMNRWFVFKPGRFRWYVEFAMFFGAATLATVIALGIMKVLIDQFGLMTSLAVVLEVLISFFVNYFVRKRFIFKG